MNACGVDCLLLSVGSDLPWCIGYEAMATERATVLVLPRDERPTLVIPLLEAARVSPSPGLFVVRPWGEVENPVRIVAELVSGRRVLGISERAWSSLLLRLQAQMPEARFEPASKVIGPLRRRKDASEMTALLRAAQAAQRATEDILCGRVPLIGRRERDIARDVSDLLLSYGHSRVNLPLVASGFNSASPHHASGGRVVGVREAVLFDFGGTWAPDGGFGYASDTSRTICTGAPSAEFQRVYSLVKAAQEAAFEVARAGVACSAVDGAARSVIERAGYGAAFIHRTGHGIGLDTHEDPYIVADNGTLLGEGDAFSVEPGIYLCGEFGVRIEDVVVLTSDGPCIGNQASRELTIVEV